MKSIKTLTVMAAVACCLASTSQAGIVLPPATSGAPGPDDPLDGAAVTIASLVSPFAFGGAFSGILTSTVLQESAAFNPLGGYTFLYVIANDATSRDGLRRYSVDGWDSTPLPVAGNTGPGLDAPIADRSLSGDIIGFDWGVVTPITPGSFGEVYVRTSQQQFTIANGSVIDSGTATVNTYAVPEPTTMIAGAMLLLPFGASTLRMLRKNRHGIIIDKIS
jgi:hypothetical protein